MYAELFFCFKEATACLALRYQGRQILLDWEGSKVPPFTQEPGLVAGSSEAVGRGLPQAGRERRKVVVPSHQVRAAALELVGGGDLAGSIQAGTEVSRFPLFETPA